VRAVLAVVVRLGVRNGVRDQIEFRELADRSSESLSEKESG
jgi:hypothetical protein